MNKLQTYFTKTIKVILWITLCFALLFILIFGFIQIPAVQTKIVHYATSFIGNKTHTKVEIKNVSISFPKSVVVEGIYLEDLKKDTLLYAGKAKINISLYDLFSNKIDIKSFALEDATLKLHSTKTDSLFNYNFLITAFGDSTKQAQVAQQTPSKWTFSIDQVRVKNIRFFYNDEYTGMNVSIVLQNSELEVDEIDPTRSVYTLNKLLFEGAKVNILATESANIQHNQSENILPVISAKNLQLNNSVISYTDSVGYLSVYSNIDKAKLENISIDLQKELLTTESVFLTNSKIQYHTFAPDLTSNETAIKSTNNWKVTAMNIDLEDDSFSYKAGNSPEITRAFDPNYWEYNHLKIEATNFQYSSDLTKVSIRKFSAIDQNNFAIKNLETDFSMDHHSISAKNIKVNTNISNLDADFKIEYSTLKTLTDSLQFSNLDLDLKNASILNSDILYFKPDLIEQPFFKNSSTVTTASGKISGQMNNLSGKNVKVKTGTNTNVAVDFTITGLPEFQSATYDFPNLKISSGKKDIEMLAGNYLPKNIELPEKVNMQSVFKGQLKSFESTVKMTSSFGDANLTASIDPDENFESNITLTNFDLGKVLKDTVMYGPVSLTAETSGQGLDLKTMKAKMKAEATALSLNKYTYHNLKMEGIVAEQAFEGKINLKDENADFDLDASANVNPGQEQIQFRLNLQGADLQKLNFSKSDLRIGTIATADFKGKSVADINGKVKFVNIVVAHNAEKYALDSVVITSVNEPNKSEFNISSDLADVNYSGSVSPFSLPSELGQFINKYFQVIRFCFFNRNKSTSGF